MRANANWRRVTRAEVCPICERPDWCLLAGPEGNPTAVICARVESHKRCGDAGWLHRLRDDDRWQTRRRTIRITPPKASRSDLAELAERCQREMTADRLCRFADGLGLSLDSLRRLRVGWSADHRAYTFPMSDASGNVLGLRLRLRFGRKLSVRGGKDGLFIPADLAGGDLLIAEGPTDSAALLDLGFSAVGRPSCTGGIKLLVDLVKRWQPAQVVIVSDLDEHGRGQRGANNLAVVLLAYSQAVRVIAPPDGINDAREWKQLGGTHHDIQSAIDAAPLRRLSIHTNKIETNGTRKRIVN